MWRNLLSKRKQSHKNGNAGQLTLVKEGLGYGTCLMEECMPYPKDAAVFGPATLPGKKTQPNTDTQIL